MTDADIPRGAVVEIYERHRNGEPVPEVGPGSILVPNEIRINGVPVWCPEDSPVVVERIEVRGSSDAVRVTLTLYARRVVIDDAPAE